MQTAYREPTQQERIDFSGPKPAVSERIGQLIGTCFVAMFLLGLLALGLLLLFVPAGGLISRLLGLGTTGFALLLGGGAIWRWLGQSWGWLPFYY